MTAPDATVTAAPQPVPRPRVWPVFVTFAVAALVALIVGAIALIAVVGLQPILSGQANFLSLPALLAVSVATEVALLGAVLVAARPLTRARLRLQRGRASAGVFAATVLGTIALGHVLETIIALAGLGRTGSLGMISHALEGAHGGRLAYAVLAIGLLAGGTEELFFRGFMQTRLSQRWRPWVAVLVAALFFAFMHFDLVHSPLALCLGIWLGFACERSGSLWPSLLAHVANNTIATLGAGVGVPLYTGAISALVFLACAVWLVRALPETARDSAV